MSNVESKNYFNGFIVAGLIVNFFMLISLWVMAADSIAQGDDALSVVIYVFMGVGLFAYVGAFALYSGQIKLGAILIMIGCGAFVPLGMFGLVGGMRILESLKNSHHELETIQPKGEGEKFVWSNSGMFMLSAIVSFVAGIFVVGMTGNGAPLIGIGVVFFILVILNQDKAIVTLYDDHMEVRKLPWATARKILYSSIKNSSVHTNGKGILIQYDTPSSEQKIFIRGDLIGKDKVSSLAQLIDNKLGMLTV